MKNKLKIGLKRKAIKLSTLLISIFFLIAFLETFLYLKGEKYQLQSSWQNDGLFIIDSEYIYRMAADKFESSYWSSDKNGFRLNPAHNEIDNNSQNIVVVGDSFTYGHGVTNTETVAFYLEKLLKDYDYEFYVHNAGVPGYGADQEFLLIKNKIIPEYNPKLIFWNLNVNDVRDSNRACLFKRIGHSYFQIPGFFNTLYQKEFFKKNNFIGKLQSTQLLISNLPDRHTFGCSSANYSYQDFEKKLFYFFTELDSFETPIIITLMPDLHELSAENNKRQNFIETFSKTSLPFIEMNTLIMSGMQDEQILGSSTENNYSFFFLDEPNFDSPHMNSQGNELVAQILMKKLSELSNLLQ